MLSASSIRVPRNLKADLLLTFCAVIWGATFVVVKDALADTSVFVFLALRFLVAASALKGMVYPPRTSRLGREAAISAGAVIGCFMFSGYAFQICGAQAGRRRRKRRSSPVFALCWSLCSWPCSAGAASTDGYGRALSRPWLDCITSRCLLLLIPDGVQFSPD